MAPSSVSLKAADRLIKIDGRQGEFLLFHIFFAALHIRIHLYVPFTAVELTEIAASLPDSVIPGYRKKRQYISALLSKNEPVSANPYCKKLFKRKRTGHYILNPNISIRQKEDWIDIYRHANIEFIEKTVPESDKYLHATIRSLTSSDEYEEIF